MWTVGALVTVVLIWLVGDFTYSRVVGYRLRRWEESVQWHADGVRIGCRGYTIGSGRAAVLLVHGFNDSPRLYSGMSRVLAEQGFTVRVMRLPGFAERMATARHVTRAQWLAALERELQQLRENHETVSIVAHSLGGAIAIRYLSEHPEAVDRAVLIAPAVGISNRRSPLLATRTWHEIGNRLLVFTSITESAFPIDVHHAKASDYGRPEYWRGLFVARSVINEIFLLLDENRGRASRILTPLMTVLSRDDKVTDWLEARRFHCEAGSSEKRLRCMQDVGHAIPLDRGWRQLTLEIAQFLTPNPEPAEGNEGADRPETSSEANDVDNGD